MHSHRRILRSNSLGLISQKQNTGRSEYLCRLHGHFHIPLQQDPLCRFRVLIFCFFQDFHGILTGDDPVMFCHISHSHNRL